jgi:hypothetical protein
MLLPGKNTIGVSQSDAPVMGYLDEFALNHNVLVLSFENLVVRPFTSYSILASRLCAASQVKSSPVNGFFNRLSLVANR